MSSEPSSETSQLPYENVDEGPHYEENSHGDDRTDPRSRCSREDVARDQYEQHCSGKPAETFEGRFRAAVSTRYYSLLTLITNNRVAACRRSS